MERSYFGRGYGLLRWEACGRAAEAPIADLGQRSQWAVSCALPGEGWHLDDIRTCTNPVPCDPTPVPTMATSGIEPNDASLLRRPYPCDQFLRSFHSLLLIVNWRDNTG